MPIFTRWTIATAVVFVMTLAASVVTVRYYDLVHNDRYSTPVLSTPSATSRAGAGPLAYENWPLTLPTGSSTAQPSRSAIRSATPPPSPAAAPAPVASDGPSGAAMPLGNLPGWTQVDAQDFNGSSLPGGWSSYDGTPGGYSASVAHWSPGMCSVSGGELHFMANGIDSCGLGSSVSPQTYGMYLVRLKGDSEPSSMQFSDIALLWPASNKWDAEIDFYEDTGGSRSQYNASMFACPNGTCPYQVRDIGNDGTQWHTYGVAWTPTSVTYTVDGRTVATFNASPGVPMELKLQSQNLGGSGAPTERETMTVDWVVEYAYTPGSG